MTQDRERVDTSDFEANLRNDGSTAMRVARLALAPDNSGEFPAIITASDVAEDILNHGVVEPLSDHQIELLKGGLSDRLGCWATEGFFERLESDLEPEGTLEPGFRITSKGISVIIPLLKNGSDRSIRL